MKRKLLITAMILIVSACLQAHLGWADTTRQPTALTAPALRLASGAICPCNTFAEMNRLAALPEGELRSVNRLWSQHAPLFPGETSLFVLHSVSYETIWLVQVTWHPDTGERTCTFVDVASGTTEERLFISEEELVACRALIVDSHLWSLCQ